jgi:hypothetical protein
MASEWRSQGTIHVPNVETNVAKVDLADRVANGQSGIGSLRALPADAALYERGFPDIT